MLYTRDSNKLSSFENQFRIFFFNNNKGFTILTLIQFLFRVKSYTATTYSL